MCRHNSHIAATHSAPQTTPSRTCSATLYERENTMKFTFAVAAVLAFAGFVGCASDATDPDTDTAEQEARRGGRNGGGSATRPGSHKVCNLDSQCPSGEECRRSICQINDNAPSSSSGGASSSGASTSSSSSGGASSSGASTSSSSSGGASSSGAASGGGGGGSATRPGSHTACTFDSQCPPTEECRRGICQINL
jgi:hypothetical protein